MRRSPARHMGVASALLLALILLGASPILAASSGHITLLTVAEGSMDTGGTADLYLTVKPGTGSIYMDSFPLTRVDTQSSVRYANQIACDLLQEDCSRYDFFYKIRANSAIVGGPSAGAAMTVLTIAVLDGQELDQKTAMTGTINSGGIIGPVAGVSAKVQGAKAAGIDTVLIPALTTSRDLGLNGSDVPIEPQLPDILPNATTPDDTNVTDVNVTAQTTANGTANGSRTGNATGNGTDATANQSVPVRQEPLQRGKVAEFSDSKITVIRVGTVEEALLEFTGKNYSRSLPALEVPAQYDERMGAIADEICGRMVTLEESLARRSIPFNDTHNYTARIAAVPEAHRYSRASLCFSKNIELATLLSQNASMSERKALYLELRTKAGALEDETTRRELNTISDLETYAIVKERILEARDLLDSDTAEDPANLAYAQERLLSAESWSRFFGLPGKQLQLDPEYLQIACLTKLAEAEERINYVRLYAPQLVDDAQEQLEEAQRLSQSEPVLCIFTASKAKAQANVMGSALSVGQESVDALVEQKLEADEGILRKQQEKGFFPILGYSYTQYSQDLRQAVPYSALIFSEYALELSNLDLYFPRESRFRLPPGSSDILIVFALGAIFGAAVVLFVVGRWHLSRSPKPKVPHAVKTPSKRRGARR